MSDQANDRTIIIHAPTRDLDEYRRIADQAVRMKEYGRVLLLAGNVADKWWESIPEGGSPWHEYASYNPTFFNVFPHPTIEPHIDMDWVMENRRFLTAQCEVLRERGLGAWFYSVEPSFLPESFFEEYPHLRGPRVDHPWRATREAFAMCIDLPETRSLYEWMVAELKRNAPEMEAITFKVNDAGSGFCWAESLYMGPNGPQHCRGRTAGQRFADFAETIHNGAVAGGGDVLVANTSSCFWGNEMLDIEHRMPPNTMILPGNKNVLDLGAMMGQTYPVLGILSPMHLFAAMEKYDKPSVKTMVIHFRASYDRAYEPVDSIEKVLDIAVDCIAEPSKGFFARQDRLRKLAAHWAGSDHAESITEAFGRMDQVFRAMNMVGGGFRPMYAGVSVRHMTRPLLLKPELLDQEQEAYFLPHVFNIRQGEARMDYIDVHGGRAHINAGGQLYSGPMTQCCREAVAIAKVFESAKDDAPQGQWLARLGTSLRLWSSVMRSSHNFYYGQRIRDRNAEILAGEPRVPEKIRTSTGHPDIQPWYSLLRDELDNTNELIAILENGGLERIALAHDARHEDTFLLGPDLIGDLKRKAKIMRDRWRDAEWYLGSPLK